MRPPELDFLRAEGKTPRMHGNGFIQLEHLDGRLHIWPYPAVAQQTESTQIHNHRFGFVSEILLGPTFDIRYDVFPDSDRWTHLRHEAKPRFEEDTELVPAENGLVYVKPAAVRLLNTGDSYTFPPGEFHEHAPGRNTVITFMRKLYTVPQLVPNVLVPVGKRPDNKFNRYQVSVSTLWEIIEAALREAQQAYDERL